MVPREHVPAGGSHSQETHAPFEICSCQAVRDHRRLGRRCRWLLSEHDRDHDHDQANSGDDLDDACTYDLDDEHLFHHDYDDYNPANAGCSVHREPAEGCRAGRNRSRRVDLQPRQRGEYLDSGLHA